MPAENDENRMTWSWVNTKSKGTVWDTMCISINVNFNCFYVEFTSSCLLWWNSTSFICYWFTINLWY